MTDAEVICAWMEPRPVGNVPNVHAVKWWDIVWPIAGNREFTWKAKALTLDRLHLVEERLTEEQWVAYLAEFLLNTYDDLTGTHKRLIHATPEQKIRALAAVLRPVVEAQS